jgi:hypothetical protein
VFIFLSKTYRPVASNGRVIFHLLLGRQLNWPPTEHPEAISELGEVLVHGARGGPHNQRTWVRSRVWDNLDDAIGHVGQIDFDPFLAPAIGLAGLPAVERWPRVLATSFMRTSALVIRCGSPKFRPLAPRAPLALSWRSRPRRDDRRATVDHGGQHFAQQRHERRGIGLYLRVKPFLAAALLQPTEDHPPQFGTDLVGRSLLPSAGRALSASRGRPGC